MSSWEKPYWGPDSRNVTVVQKQLNAPNTQAPINARERSTGSDRATASTPRICSR